MLSITERALTALPEGAKNPLALALALGAALALADWSSLRTLP
jgi:hypothetical protein